MTRGFGSAHSRVPNLLASDHAPAHNLPLRWADEVPLDSASGELPEPGPQARQDCGFQAHDGEGDLTRNQDPQAILRQNYGLGPARICFKPQGFAVTVICALACDLPGRQHFLSFRRREGQLEHAAILALDRDHGTLLGPPAYSWSRG